MQVDVHTPLPVPYVMIEAPLPSGAECTDDVMVRLKTVDANKKERQIEESTSALRPGAYGMHTDILDDRMAFFYTDLPTGDISLGKVLRMEMPGHFNVNPVTLQAMYTTGIRGYSSVDRVNVSETASK